MLKVLNDYEINEFAISAYCSKGTDYERWIAMQIPKSNLCQLDGPVKFSLTKEDCQDSMHSENNDGNECDQSTSPGIKFFEDVTNFFYHFRR